MCLMGQSRAHAKMVGSENVNSLSVAAVAAGSLLMNWRSELAAWSKELSKFVFLPPQGWADLLVHHSTDLFHSLLGGQSLQTFNCLLKQAVWLVILLPRRFTRALGEPRTICWNLRWLAQHQPYGSLFQDRCGACTIECPHPRYSSSCRGWLLTS